ncbi:hypothetical protein FIBSPDRAFT_847240 [Athelia psychrophila]|uniref:Uncharacterized protein n=1 Tax=Athelia psychrophila TaxID=1759441 RepID=A0A166WTU8_9AGAM|nr:hypothetical protein FIBSPDRAFT_859852 [Fibularhizoctonia sp. CBS 109695]KZP34104.1 hypothetical protein FIBSPDRAFT_847240 [Fibularhizoctonia sp. CBS 109695]
MRPSGPIFLLSSVSISPTSQAELKHAPVAYLALLHYTGAGQASLQYLPPSAHARMRIHPVQPQE